MMRLPNELLRNNFRAAHRLTERRATQVKSALAEATRIATASRDNDIRSVPVMDNQVERNAEAIAALDQQISRIRATQARINTLADEETSLHQKLARRSGHLDDLMELHTVDDIRYYEWARLRLDRLIVDHQLRQGWEESAKELIVTHGLEDLVDIEPFLIAKRIRQALINKSFAEALQWTLDNKHELRKMNVRACHCLPMLMLRY